MTTARPPRSRAQIVPPAEGEREFAMTREDFRALAKIVYDHAGIVLSEQKQELVYGRLARRIRALGLRDFAAYRALLASDAGAQEFGELVNAVTTNHTRFFREPHHFDFLRDQATATWRARPDGGRRIRVWSAGCSTGEEPYSLAITLNAALSDGNWDWRILATDIDTNVLARARRGEYGASAQGEIPAALRAQSVEPVSGGGVRIREHLRNRITFNQLNLLDQWPVKGPFDAIFCRNVTIYFDLPTKTRLIERFSRLLKPDGYLFVGHSESILGARDGLEAVGRTIYSAKGARA